MIQPHGGTLINKELPKIEKQRILEQIDEFEKIQVNSETWNVIKNIAFGVFSPLEGFMNENDTLHVLDHMYLENNIAWPFPIILDISENQANKINVDDNVIITDTSDTPIALLNVSDIYNYNKKQIIKLQKRNAVLSIRSRFS